VRVSRQKIVEELPSLASRNREDPKTEVNHLHRAAFIEVPAMPNRSRERHLP
jgi:hypothetical protein